MRTVAAVEIDPAARMVFSRNFPESTLFDDVTKVGGDDIRATGFVPERGVITAGWPCQDISRAGKQHGITGQRSSLFFDVIRLLVELQPKWFVLENVPRLLSINSGSDMGAVVGSLVECGYGIGYRVLDSQHFGVAQKRRRIFFVGLLGDTGQHCAEILFDTDSLRGTAPQNRQARQGNKPDPAGVDGTDSWCERTISTLQGGGRRGYRIDAEGVAGGHLLVGRIRGAETNPS